MKIKILNRKGEKILSGKYLYLEHGHDTKDTQNFFIVLNNEDGDSEIHFDGSKEEIKHFRDSLNEEFEDEAKK